MFELSAPLYYYGSALPVSSPHPDHVTPASEGVVTSGVQSLVPFLTDQRRKIKGLAHNELHDHVADMVGRSLQARADFLRQLLELRRAEESREWIRWRFNVATWASLSRYSARREPTREDRLAAACALSACIEAELVDKAEATGEHVRSACYFDHRCLVTLAHGGRLRCADLQGGRERLLSFLQLVVCSRSIHNCAILDLLHHFKLSLDDVKAEARVFADDAVNGFVSHVSGEPTTSPAVLMSFLRLRPFSWWALPTPQLDACAQALRQLRGGAAIASELAIWMAPESLSRDRVLEVVSGTEQAYESASAVAVLAGLRQGNIAVAEVNGGSASVLRYVRALLRKPRTNFMVAVGVAVHFNLPGKVGLRSLVEAELLAALKKLVSSDLMAAKVAVHALRDEPALNGPSTNWRDALSGMRQITNGPMYWPAWVAHVQSGGSLPTLTLEVPVHLVSNTLDVEAAQSVLTAATIIGVDVEWEPGTNIASILQLATCHEVYVFDLQELDVQMAATALACVFSDPSIRKLGFDFNHSDWLHLSPWLAVAHNVTNLDHLWQLRQPEESILGLRSLVAKTLACRLSKEQQCSNWSRRPLSKEQLEYAALDAHCLLQIWHMLEPTQDIIAASTVQLHRDNLVTNAGEDTAVTFNPKGPALELRAGVVLSVSIVSGAEHILRCSVDLGPCGKRQLVQGCTVVPGQRVLVFCNLVHREMFGLLSQGGLLVAYYKDGVPEAVAPPQSAALGASVWPEAQAFPLVDLTIPDNVWAQCQGKFSTSTSGQVFFQHKCLEVKGEACTVQSGAGAYFR